MRGHHIPSTLNATVPTLDEARKERQKEWEEAYKNSDNPPPLKDEVPYDPRTLYERLQEQKQKKDEAFAEATKFDNDEFDFLNSLENEEAQKKRELAEQEAKELEVFRQNQLKTQAPQQPPIPSVVVPLPTIAPSQAGTGSKKAKKSLFGGLVKRKSSTSHVSTDDTGRSTTKDAAQNSETSHNASSKDGALSSNSLGKRKESSEDKQKDIAHDVKKAKVTTPTVSVSSTKPDASKPGLLGLVAYDSSSDEDDD
ncbi:hypothetical protein BGZ94_003161 [Podila epigama]|nr:hypothetical protein BGZ94_003161 [Podila epigama]